jgi:hypothetical protein
MNYLFIDDMPEYLKIHVRTLRKAGHAVETARDVGAGWSWIIRSKTEHPFDMVIIDLALDRKIREFDREYEEMSNVLGSRGYGELRMSGQALGLRLWRRRKEIHQRYCYVTNHPQLWLDNINGADPEFGGETTGMLSDLVLDKPDLWRGNIEEKLQNAYNTWEKRQWFR